MDLKEIKKIIKVVEEAGITAFSLEEKGVKIEVKKEFPQAAFSTGLPHPIMPAMPVSVSQTAPLDAAMQETKTPEEDSNLIAVKSPMVGTFYSSPNPESPAYVKVGDTVKKGDVVCIIEAMKIFNEIETEESGTIEKICVENSAAVEYGQALYYIRANG
ncbi:acetyl-CoA carboxylase biotin carboxyl carrier protein [Candidatus Margulisiibacteriota bacterium]